MRVLTFAVVVFVFLACATDAQAACRRPVRNLGAAVLSWRPGDIAKAVAEKRPVRRALGRLVCGRCG